VSQGNNSDQGGQDNVVLFQRKQGILDTARTEEQGMWTTPLGTIFGVQLIENSKTTDVCLYSEQYKANTIARALNEKFAQLKVNHEAKVIHYPVY